MVHTRAWPRISPSTKIYFRDNQRDWNSYKFNNIGFIVDISIFADKPEGIQKRLNVVQTFTAWCGMQINVKKIYLLIIDDDKKCKEQEPVPLLTIDGETLQTMNLVDACRCLRYWGTGNGDMRATKAKDHCSTRPDQMPSSDTRASNGIVHEQRYGGLPLLSGTH